MTSSDSNSNSEDRINNNTSNDIELQITTASSPEILEETTTTTTTTAAEYDDVDDDHIKKKKKKKGKERKEKHPNTDTLIPYATANPLSKLLYSWQTPFMRLGYREPLETSDLYALPPELETQWNGERIQSAFHTLLQQHTSKQIAEQQRQQQQEPKKKKKKEKKEKKNQEEPIPLSSTDAIPTTAATKETSEPESDPAIPPFLLLKALFNVYGTEWMLGGLCQGMSIVLPLVSPYLLYLLMDYLQTLYTNPDAPDRPPIWQGLLYVIGMFALQLSSTLFNSLFFTICMKLGMQVRSGLITAIYQKALTFSAHTRTHTFPPGKLTNIIATDTVRLDFVTPYLHMLWSSPVQIVVILGVLLKLLGPSVLVGFALMLVFLPLQGLVLRHLTTYRREVQKVTDQRMTLMHELLVGVKLIKLFAWEPSIAKQMHTVRSTEVGWVRKLSVWRSAINAVSQVVPAVTAIVVFAVYAAVGNPLTASVIFTAMAYFNMLRLPLMFLPMMLAFAADAKVALQRVQTVLGAPSVPSEQMPTRGPLVPGAPAIVLDKVALAWEEGAAEVVKDVSLQIPVGALVAVVGRVGQGKSSLLAGMVGEVRRTQGEMVVRGAVSYCPQQPWIQNASVKENILFGLPYNETKYRRAIHLACLQRDLDQLPDGELTEIGEKGINLSGGQKARINLARAIYFDADTVLLDDPLSAVDAHVGAFLFFTTIQQALKSKTRVLVTHALHYVPHCDYVIVVHDGQIQEQGTFAALMAADGGFAKQMRAFGGIPEEQPNNQEGNGKDQAGSKLEVPATLVREDETNSGTENALGVSPSSPSSSSSSSSTNTRRRSGSRHTKGAGDTVEEGEKKTTPTLPPSPKTKAPEKLMKEEERATGNVAWHVYLGYFRAAGGLVVLVAVVMVLVLGQVFRAGTDLWLAAWTHQEFELPLHTYLGVYFALGIAQLITYVVNGVQVAFAGVVASRRMHQGALDAILTAPMSFFDTTPLGRITNRFSKDMDALDNNLTDALRMFASTLAVCVSALCLIFGVTPYFIIPTVPLLVLYYFIQKFYRATSRELKRLDSISRSPVFAQFTESLHGIVTIRAYGEQDRFVRRNQVLMNLNNRPYFLQLCAQRWLAIRIETIGAFLTFFAGLFGLLTQGSLLPALVGLSIGNALQLTGVLNWCVRQAAETEVQMNSVERIQYYMEALPKEAAYELPVDETVDIAWPAFGELEFRNVTLAYRPGLPPVLHNVNLHFLPAEKVGIVGRTGAGKSSLLASLFRLVEVSEGEIVLDGIALHTLGLKKVRGQLGIIPQDPVLFAGTLRSNLDRFMEYSDQAIWDTLGRAGLRAYVQALPLKLDFMVTENGDNLSVGQRQLMCLARALLRKTKVLVLDEVTASVDAETDMHIQRAIREELHRCTIITIAHRLNTIMDYDKIVVMEQGRVAEVGAPFELVQRPGSLLNALIDETGPTNAETLRALALKSRKVT